MIVFLKYPVRMRFSGIVADRDTTWCQSEIAIVFGQLEFPWKSCTALWEYFARKRHSQCAKKAGAALLPLSNPISELISSSELHISRQCAAGAGRYKSERRASICCIRHSKPRRVCTVKAICVDF